MATPSNLPRLLRAAAFHRNATTLLNLNRPSPTTFLLFHSSNLGIPNPPFFSTSTFRSVQTRATSLQNPQYAGSISNPSNPLISNRCFFSTSTSRRVQTRAATLQTHRSIWLYGIAFGCIGTGLMVVNKFQGKSVEGLKGTVNEQMELRVRGVLPGLFRKGHSVVVEGFAVPVTDETWECYLSLTEVLAKPEKINFAMERNHNIMAEKLKVVEEEKLKVANEKLKVAEGAEQEAAADWYTTSSEAITKYALKTKSEVALNPKTEVRLTMALKILLVRFQGLSEVLREGDSVFVKVFEKTNTDEIKEDEPDEILEDKLADINQDKLAKSMTAKVGDTEYHISVEAFSKHDEKFMPQEVAAVIIAE